MWRDLAPPSPTPAPAPSTSTGNHDDDGSSSARAGRRRNPPRGSAAGRRPALPAPLASAAQANNADETDNDDVRASCIGAAAAACPLLPSFYAGGEYLVEGVFTRRPREAMTPAQAARFKKQVCGCVIECVWVGVYFFFKINNGGCLFGV